MDLAIRICRAIFVAPKPLRCGFPGCEKLFRWSTDSRSGRLSNPDDGCHTDEQAIHLHCRPPLTAALVGWFETIVWVVVEGLVAVIRPSRVCSLNTTFFILQRNIRSFATGFSSCLQELVQINIFNDLQIHKNWPIFCALRDFAVLFRPV